MVRAALQMPAFPLCHPWFEDNRHFDAIAAGLRQQGFSDTDVAGIMGENWLAFYDSSFGTSA